MSKRANWLIAETLDAFPVNRTQVWTRGSLDAAGTK